MFYFRIFLLFAFSAPLAAAPSFVHCYDFGCKSTQELRYSEDHWRQISALFEQEILDIRQEKQAIRRAVALMERISGELSGTHLDKGGNYPGYDLERQMDCIDESTNTFQYLLALEQLQLLRWHRVEPKQRRIVWLATHWTATIREIGSNARFAVDSWYRDNGELPYLQPLEDWKRKRRFPVAYNPELASN
ncbi:MAG: hypothetical protein OEU50_13195 [Gammaproteobacteria bacterium]|nr:hypothetical protein [Gammaproteobacteria bacterium]